MTFVEIWLGRSEGFETQVCRVSSALFFFFSRMRSYAVGTSVLKHRANLCFFYNQADFYGNTMFFLLLVFEAQLLRGLATIWHESLYNGVCCSRQGTTPIISCLFLFCVCFSFRLLYRYQGQNPLRASESGSIASRNSSGKSSSRKFNMAPVRHCATQPLTLVTAGTG